MLYKSDPRFVIGKVASMSNQYPQFNFQQPLNPGNGPVVDMTVEVDGKMETFTRIPLNSSIAEFPDKNVIVSETRDGIVNEINAIRSKNQAEIDQLDARKQAVAACDRLLLEVNPQLKKEQEQANEIAALKNQIAEMGSRFNSVSDQLAALTGMLSKSLGKKTKEE